MTITVNSTITIDIEEREEREQMCLPKEAVVSFKIFFVPSKSLAVMKLIIHLMAMHIRGPGGEYHNCEL